MRTLSLYSGCGGLDLGFTRAGFDVVHAVEIDPIAVRTYRDLIGPHIACASVDQETLEMPGEGDVEIVVGGPPCQGFSVAGKMDPHDPRSRHVWRFLEIVESVQPRAFVMENVKALGASPRWEPMRRALLSHARSLGYEAEITILNASHHGVPQRRERMFLVGIRDGSPPDLARSTVAELPTVRGALGTLPEFGRPGNRTGGTAAITPARRPVLRPSPFRGSLLFNGNGRPLELDAPAPTLPASMGGNATPIVDQEEIYQGAEPWVAEYHRHLLAGGRPRSTSSSRLRRITVEEAAALQTFPPGMEWHGTISAQYRQIGNAVPPLLAESVARRLAASLIGSKHGRARSLVAV